MPSLSVVHTDAVALEERRAGAFLSGKTERAGTETVDEPFEADRGFDQLAVQLFCDAIDDRTGDDGLADRRLPAPLRPVLEQIGDRGGKKMVRVHQAARARHDAVPVGIGIVGKGNVEFVAHRNQARHRIRRRTIHPDLAVPIRGHETECRIDGIVHDRRIDSVMLDERLPVMNGGAAQRIDSDFHAR